VVGVLGVEGGTDLSMLPGEVSLDVRGQVKKQVVAERGDTVEGRQRPSEHRGDVNASQREIEHDERLCEVGIELKQRQQQGLVELRRSEGHAIQRPEERQQVEPCGLESSLEISRNLVPDAPCHVRSLSRPERERKR